MKTFRFLFGGFALLVWALSSAVAAATAVFYECDMDVDIPNGWVSPKIGVVVAENGSVSVIDGILIAFDQSPAEVKTRQKGDVLRLNWTLSNAVGSNGTRAPKFAYTARLNTETKAISVLAKPVGFPQRFSADGTCRVRKS